MANKKTTVIPVILAAGSSTRLVSSTPKPLQKIAGRTMIGRLLDSLQVAGFEKPLVVVSPSSKSAIAEHVGTAADLTIQETPTGTGDAALIALDALPKDCTTLLLYVDVPLLGSESFKALAHNVKQGKFLRFFSGESKKRNTEGRVIRGKNGSVLKVVESAEANYEEKLVTETNKGGFFGRASDLKQWLSSLKRNHKNETGLSALVENAVEDKADVQTVQLDDPFEGFGVNTKAQLAKAEKNSSKPIV